MDRLTEKDVCGNWRLKGLPWKNLYEGTPITRETYEVLYGALCKLLAYEETGLTPEEIEMRTYCTMGTPCEFQSSKIRKDGWIPVEERMPKEEPSIFAKFKGTSKWSNSMFEKTSKEVNVTIEDDKGKKVTTHARTCDGEWRCDLLRWNKTYRVTAWQQLPEPYRPEKEGQKK